MEGLKIIKASAGSGKTDRLSKEYLETLLAEGNDAYRHILAVTFTNKATDEMKGRIIELLAEKSEEESEAGKKAKDVLTALLHDYSGFSISTIDRFFQGVMRAFAREIGEFASYKVELDSDGVLGHAVDLMMASLEDPANADLFEWLKEFSMSQIENGEKWDITSDLKEMAKLFLNEDFKVKKRGLEDVFGNRQALKSMVGDMESIVTGYEKDLKDLGNRALAIIGKHQLSVSDFYYGSSTVGQFEKMVNGKDLNLSGKYFTTFSQGLENWVAKSAKKDIRSRVEEAYYDGLGDAVSEALALAGPESERLKEYNTAVLLRRGIYLLGIFSDLYAQMRNYLKENNMILLGETAEVLGKIIDGNDTPFIYEKTGTRFDHYMLDEFQDTSRLQWENFKPLLGESIARGESNLIVGDIKQSIYRWRGADLTLLGEELQRSFPRAILDPLKFNWRSARNIVDFNNGFYERIGELMGGYDADIAGKVGDFYSGCRQIIEKEKHGNGHVKVFFLPEKEDNKTIWKDIALEMTGDLADSLRKRYDLSDITFLVRTGREGRQIAAKLISLGYDVITEDSLNIATSMLVRKVVALLSRVMNPDDKVNNQLLVSMFDGEAPEFSPEENVSPTDTSLYGLCESLLGLLCDEVPASETPFVTAFMDSVLSYMERFGSDLAGFLDWWDSTGSRMSIPASDSKDSIRVMTIHKAKGLKSGAVVIPFLEGKFTPPYAPFIWCRPTVEPFSGIGLVPVKAAASLADTIFSKEYANEVLFEAVDAVNTAYVAMTRAVGDMIIMAPMPDEDKKGYKPGSVSALLYAHLKGELDADGIYESGRPDEDRRSKKDASAGLKLGHYKTIPLAGRLGVRLRSGDYYDREAGIVRHDILARVNTAADIARAVAAAVNEEELPASEAASVTAEMEGYLASVADRHWFDGTYVPMNEASIVAGNGEVFRPDRVLLEKGKPIGEGKAIVIDYKFGCRKNEHREQVDNYMNLLKGIGYSDVRGYIWYCKLNSVEECD